MKKSRGTSRSGRRPGARHASARAESVETVATVRIDSIAAGGDGVARINGLACFVPRTAPGDLVQIAYTSHARYARGRVLQRVEDSALRTEAPCAHYEADRCGGCQLQHLSDDAQRDTLRHVVKDAIGRVGHREVPLPEIVMGTRWGYRDRLTLALREKGSGWLGGLYRYDDHRVFALEECPIAHPSLVAMWHRVRRALRALPRASADHPLRLSLRMAGASRTEVALVVLGGRAWDDAVSWAAHVHASTPGLSAIWWIPEDADAVFLAGDPDLSALAFEQVNPEMASQLRAMVWDEVMSRAPNTVVDAYAGRGDLAERLAHAGIHVTAIESDARATLDASRRLAAYSSARVITGLVEECIEAVLPADVVVLNPPRRGIDVHVAAALAESKRTTAIVYVSCDPATLARDLSRLPHWQIASLRCFDMFPQTAHVETVCVLTQEEG
ncbi:MAG: class I SAM-dependent RNA methyltransferase [Gemmatimonadaceae bacterium]|nr:class I SAM-dependent RNA methyltransferase [Gemmatimonadaceae bacterium]